MIGGYVGVPIGGVITDAVAVVALSSVIQSMFSQKVAGTYSAFLPGRVNSQFKAGVQGGYALPGRVNSQFKAGVQGGYALPGRVNSQFKTKAPGGVLVAGTVNSQFKAKAPGGLVMLGSCSAQFKGSVGSGVVLIGIAKIQLTMLDSVFVKRVVTDDRLPLFLKSGPSYWRGRG